jgi:predicted small lipoprotein YifL
MMKRTALVLFIIIQLLALAACSERGFFPDNFHPDAF